MTSIQGGNFDGTLWNASVVLALETLVEWKQDWFTSLSGSPTGLKVWDWLLRKGTPFRMDKHGLKDSKQSFQNVKVRV